MVNQATIIVEDCTTDMEWRKAMHLYDFQNTAADMSDKQSSSSSVTLSISAIAIKYLMKRDQYANDERERVQ